MSRIYNKIYSSAPRWLIVSISIYIILLFSANIIKLYYGLYNGLDLAISNQVFWNSINGNLFESSIQPPSYLAYHFAVFNLFILPFYKIIPSPLTLLFIQTIFLAIAAFPLYGIAKKYLNKKNCFKLYVLVMYPLTH